MNKDEVEEGIVHERARGRRLNLTTDSITIWRSNGGISACMYLSANSNKWGTPVVVAVTLNTRHEPRASEPRTRRDARATMVDDGG